jgi:KDO2-lipid IV(A) lauroyltransferase
MIPRAKRISNSTASGSDTGVKQTPQWYTHSYNRPILYRLITACSPFIPRPIRLGLARTIASVLQQRMPQEEAAARRNLARILPGADATAIERIVRALFGNFAAVFTDLLSLNRQALPVLQTYVHGVHGLERLQATLVSGRGFVAATAHMGNWDLAGRLLSVYGRTVHVLVAPEQHAAIHRLLRQRGGASGLRFVTNDSAERFVQLLMALRRGDIVAVQADRTTGHRRDVPVKFFGTAACFPSGPFVLAAAAQAPVLPCFCLLRPDQRYNIFVDEPIAVLRDREDVALQQMVGVLERYVAMAPDQWFNFYDVWDNTFSV